MAERQYLTPPEAATRLGVAPEKIIGWIRRGELRAVNLASTMTGRARYAIDRTELELFLARRAVGPAPRVTRSRTPSRPAGWVEYIT